MIRGGSSYVTSPPSFSNDAKKLLVCTGNTVSVFSAATGLKLPFFFEKSCHYFFYSNLLFSFSLFFCLDYCAWRSHSCSDHSHCCSCFERCLKDLLLLLDRLSRRYSSSLGLLRAWAFENRWCSSSHLLYVK